MLNTAYSKKNIDFAESDYILPSSLIDANKNSNSAFNTGKELRLQKIYGDEIWLKISSLTKDIDWSNKEIADICCGTGFLSYHLLARVKPLKLTLLDISEEEIAQAHSLLSSNYDYSNIDYQVGDFLKLDSSKASFDIIIGNSFLHHFYDLPLALEKIRSMLRPGGIFISLHEPTVASRAYESRNPSYVFLYMARGDRYLDDCRYKGDGIRPGHGADVWIFNDNDLVRLFKNAGFSVQRKINWHFFRTIFVSVFCLHLGHKKTRLNRIQEFILRSGIFLDSVLNKFLPSKFFSSVCIFAKKDQ